MLAEPLSAQSGENIIPLHKTGEHIIVIGSGPVGLRFADEIFKLNPEASVQVFGNEPFAPYNRVQLTALLAGQITRDEIDLPLPEVSKYPGFSFDVATIADIDRDKQCVIDSFGQRHRYDTLIFATGARSHVPNIPGVEKKGVYQFRRLSDTEALLARVASARSVVVLGGGLLGVEASKALMRSGTQVTLIQQGPHLMNRQLDPAAAALLQADIEALGIRVITDSGVREINGEHKVASVKTRSGEIIECDTVLVCAGIKANKELAMRAGLPVGQGIIVDDRMRTNDSKIFAIGECAEHRGVLYGLVQPGLEQAAIAARAIASTFKTTPDSDELLYKGSPSVSRLKVVGKAVCSMGEVTELQKEPFLTVWHFRNKKQGIYRKLVLKKGRLIGALSFGEWSETSRVQRSLLDHTYIWPWQRLMFLLTGRLWIGSDAGNVQKWPDTTIVCQCKQVTKGEINAASLAVQPCSIESVQKACGASTVCGSCQPLVAELIQVAPLREKSASTLLVMTLLALVVGALIVAMPEAQVSDSVITQGWYEGIWNDKFWKQVTGFSLLGMSVLGLIMSLRKRLDWAWLGGFRHWRVAHLVLGVMAVSTLILHTGFHLGSNLNQWLMLNFLTLVAVGALAGMSISFAHVLKPRTGQSLRKFWTWTHIIVSWPLPALLAAHILTVYYF